MSESSRVTKFESILWEALSSGSVNSLDQIVSQARAEGDDQSLTFATVIVDDEWSSSWLARMSQVELVDHRSASGVQAAWFQDRDGEFVVSLWPTDYDSVFHVVAKPSVTDNRWAQLERAVDRASSTVSRCFLNERDFLAIGEELGSVGSVEVSRLTARVLQDGSSYSRGWRRDGNAGRPELETAANEVAGFAAVRTLTVHVEDRLSAHLRRFAGATFYSGSFQLFSGVVLESIASAVSRRREVLRNKQRERAKPLESAISLRLAPKSFATPESIANALSIASSQRNTGIAILHRNPYLHFAVTDYLDGSNFDAFITDDDSLDIYPGYRASVGALGRVTDFLAEELGSVEIVSIPASSGGTREEFFVFD